MKTNKTRNTKRRIRKALTLCPQTERELRRGMKELRAYLRERRGESTKHQTSSTRETSSSKHQ